MKIFSDIKNAITRFTRWLAGVDGDILETCPEGDRRKYSNLGIFVFFSFCVGYMVFSYLAGIAGQGSFSIWIVGLFAGLFLAAIDRLFNGKSEMGGIMEIDCCIVLAESPDNSIYRNSRRGGRLSSCLRTGNQKTTGTRQGKSTCTNHDFFICCFR